MKQIVTLADLTELVTYPAEMGENEAKECGLTPKVIGSIQSGKTSSADTKNAAREMEANKVQLILFAGGDGTARDICDAIDCRVPVLGIPAGVKIHSGAFALNPASAGEVSAKFLKEDLPLEDVEVMDIDEEAFREGRVSARLYGYLRVPYERRLIQNVKVGSSREEGEEYQKRAVAAHVTEEMEDDWYYILGPGSTTKAIADELGVDKTLLGVDVVNRGKLVAKDVNETQLIDFIPGKKVKIIVTPIGGQGFIFGRGNQQISPAVITKVGKANVIIVATRRKLDSMTGKPLLVDTGSEEVDRMLEGYMRVVAGYREELVKKIKR